MAATLGPRENARKTPQRVVLVTGLSGAGKGSILRVFEDLDFETVDNPPLDLLEGMVVGTDRHFAVGVDARTRGFDPAAVLDALGRLRGNPALRPELLYAWASETALLRRYTESRRRHPVATHGRVVDGIEAEARLTARLRSAADLIIDTSNLPLAGLRRMVEHRFAGDPGSCGKAGLAVTLMSFAFPAGLPPEADMVFDARFLQNPHYEPELRPLTGLDPAVQAYIEADPDYAHFQDRIAALLNLVLPRFVQEGKKYATIAVGCTGGRHRSVHTAEKLATLLRSGGWHVAVNHRELADASNASTQLDHDPSATRWSGDERQASRPASPQEA